MKTKLLFFFALVPFAVLAQDPILQYYGYVAPEPFDDGLGHRSYVIVNTDEPIDQSPSGANAVWNFSDLISAGFSAYDNALPTVQELADYPNTTRVVTNTIDTNTSKAYFADGASSISFTGATTSGLTLNYSTNNGKIGDFPMAYGYTNTDATAGAFEYDIYSGTFAGTIETTVDAYGALTTGGDLPWGVGTDNVTRVKIVQEMSLSLPFLPNIGTVSQTTYQYFRSGDYFPYFSSVTTTIVAPIASIDQTITVMEHAVPAILGTPTFSLSGLKIAPNPVNDLLTIRSDNTLEIQSLKIMDVNGKIILSADYEGNPVNVSGLTKGIYFAEITTDVGKVMKKIIKK